MKKIIFLISLLFFATIAFSQQKSKGSGKFDIENLYLGGGINLGAGNRSFAVGLIPEVGYSITNWLDAGISVNLNYQTQKIIDPYTGSVFAKYRAFNYGGGPFVRLWPVDFLHVVIQPEINWTRATQVDVYSNQKTTATFKANSFLIGIGYGSRQIGRQLSYFTLMIDLATDINSPYRDQYNHAQPVFRTGVGFYLRKKKK